MNYHYYQHAEQVIEFQANRSIDVLFLDESLKQELRLELISKNKIVLTALSPAMWEAKEHTIQCNADERVIRKYQSIDTIFQELDRESSSPQCVQPNCQFRSCQHITRQDEVDPLIDNMNDAYHTNGSYELTEPPNRCNQYIHHQHIEHQTVGHQNVNTTPVMEAECHAHNHIDVSSQSLRSSSNLSASIYDENFDSGNSNHSNQVLRHTDSFLNKQKESTSKEEIYHNQTPISSPKTVKSNTDQGRIIAIYSPIHRIGKTKFAIELGKEIARSECVLYLNLEGYSGSSYFHEKNTEDVSSLIYHARQDNEGISLLLSSMVSQLGEMDYIEPAFIANELLEVQAIDWIHLLHNILEKSIYEVIVIDLGEKIQGLFEILSICDTVYTPYIEDAVSLGKLKQYTENLMRCGYATVLEHTIQKRMVMTS